MKTGAQGRYIMPGCNSKRICDVDALIILKNFVTNPSFGGLIYESMVAALQGFEWWC